MSDAASSAERSSPVPNRTEPTGTEPSGAIDERLTRDRSWVLYAAAPAVPGVACMVYAAVGGPVWMALGIAVTMLATHTTIRAWHRAPVHEERGRLELDERGLRWNGAPWIARPTIRRVAWRVDPKYGAVVHVAGARWPEAQIAVSTAVRARSLVERLGYGAAARTATFSCLSRILERSQAQRGLGVVFTLVGAILVAHVLGASRGGQRSIVGMLAFMAALGALVVVHIARTHVEVGSDGIVLRWLGRRVFVAFADVTGVERIERTEGMRAYLGVAIRRRRGSPHLILVGTEDAAAERELLAARLEEALASHHAEDREADAASLSQRGRPPREWVRALRARGAGADADARTAPLSRDRLWAMVEDGAAHAPARAAAAVAVAADATTEERERIRIAARATASPGLRVALERAAEPAAEEDTLADALGRIEEPRRAATLGRR